MPITDRELEDIDHRIRFEKPGEVHVWVGPCSVSLWTGPKIPLDGRHYSCAGKIILKNGRELFANLPIQTHSFDFLERGSVYCRLGDAWYGMHEPELFAALGLSAEEALPYTWLPDRPLDYPIQGPYPMDGHAAFRASK